MRYQIYAEESRKELRGAGMGHLPPGVAWRALALLHARDRVRMLLYFREWMWQRAGRPVLFPETERLARVMSSARCEVTSASFRMPFGVFALAVPLALKLPSPLVSRVSCGEMWPLIQEFQALCNANNRTPAPENPGYIRTTLVARPANGPLQTLDIEDASLGACFLSRERFRQFLDGGDGPPDLLGDASNALMHYDLLRLVLGMSVYVAAFPETMVPGLPEGVTPKDMSHKKDPKTGFVAKAGPLAGLCGGERREGVREHYRDAHFRELRDPRYRRTPEGHVRIVPVKASIVGAGEDPYTVLER